MNIFSSSTIKIIKFKMIQIIIQNNNNNNNNKNTENNTFRKH